MKARQWGHYSKINTETWMRELESSLFWGLYPSLPGIFTGLHKEMEYLKQMLRPKNNVTSVNKKNTDWKGYDGGCGQVYFVFEDYYVKAHWLCYLPPQRKPPNWKLPCFGEVCTQACTFQIKIVGLTLARWLRGILSYHISLLTKNHSFLLGPVHYAFYLKDILTLEGTDTLACLL